ncbi:FAD/NAD-P-binding domain-containing protein [Gymnopilus junonius]|uniref:FAD/NAD-P-binding domain-containing protein n=1 Tax=Gymnopilus junonius TaxID=109634 RepID=A0A9P5NUL9_GYMJU|nr:FAD/NAD-P-binding domain-containing protein [Gymnopilus junonius]
MMSPLKLAIIGGGPSAFYVASRILKLQPEAQNLRIHMFDRLWAPHGLVRYGVAPDHPEVKNCTHKFDQAASDPRLHFFGNIDVGSTSHSIPHALPLPLASIFKNYTHVLFATGCTLPTLHPDLPQSHTASPLSTSSIDKVQHVSIIGMGNVSLDVARMLLTSVNELKKYDVPQRVLGVLAKSTVKHVSIIGRRGPLEAAFTVKELREMINLPEASMVPLDPSLFVPTPPFSSSEPPHALTRQQSRVLQLLERGSKHPFGSTPKTWSLDFFRSPIGLVPPSPSSQAQLSLAHTTLDPQTSRAVPTGLTSTLSTDLVITSLGFHGEPTLAFYDPGLRHLRTVRGRVVSSTGVALKRVYASGWAATGAKGVLASTMMNAYTDWKEEEEEKNAEFSSESESALDLETPETEAQAQKDTQFHSLPPLAQARHYTFFPSALDAPPKEIQEVLKAGPGVEKKVTTYGDWREVDKEEVRRGEMLGKERERMGWVDARAFLEGRT